MSKINVGLVFSREFIGNDPLGHIGVKLPVYERLLALCEEKGWGAYVLTRKTYKGDGVFEGSWVYHGGEFKAITTPVKIDLVYDRTAGVKFPADGDESVIWVNRRDFKVLAWDKWAAYQEIGEYMPQTILIEDEKDSARAIDQIKTDWVVLKPFNGLKGIGVFVGTKEDAKKFKFPDKYKKYIAQGFVDTSEGIPGITPGLHDLRVAIVNGNVVWSHIRVPPQGSFKANAAAGGILTEIDPSLIPNSVMEIVKKIGDRFSREYDNPIYSLDFGVEKGEKAVIFEINDQIGFPKWEMKNRDKFLRGLIDNFAAKLQILGR
jgi:glutathione synthase/RimK-type ligase-like ATP-grasp enzyme